MATIRIDGDTLHVELHGAEPLWAVHGSFHIPLGAIAAAHTAKPPGFWDALKIIGTNAPWLTMAGTFLYHGEMVFFDYRGNEDRVLGEAAQRSVAGFAEGESARRSGPSGAPRTRAQAPRASRRLPC